MSFVYVRSLLLAIWFLIHVSQSMLDWQTLEPLFWSISPGEEERAHMLHEMAQESSAPCNALLLSRL